MCQHGASHFIEHGIALVTFHEFATLLHRAQLQHFGLGRSASASLRGDCRRSRRKYRRLGNAALIEREAVTSPLDHTFGFEPADVGLAAIEVLRQCRCADRRSPLGDGRAIHGDGLNHRVRSGCVAVR